MKIVSHTRLAEEELSQLRYGAGTGSANACNDNTTQTCTFNLSEDSSVKGTFTVALQGKRPLPQDLSSRNQRKDGNGKVMVSPGSDLDAIMRKLMNQPVAMHIICIYNRVRCGSMDFNGMRTTRLKTLLTMTRIPMK